MGDEERTITELREELVTLRQRIRQLEKIELEHRETLEDLREREANYRLLFSAETDAIIIVDAETRRITDANEAAEKLYGYNREEIPCSDPPVSLFLSRFPNAELMLIM